MPAAPRTLFEKIWDDHAIGDDLLFVDLHLVHEVTSPQAFEGLRARRPARAPARPHDRDGRPQRPDRARADPDDLIAQAQLDGARAQLRGVRRAAVRRSATARKGIVHVIGPELGLTQPGMTIVCGDSHTSTHGAFGALAFGIGTSEVEHVLATQTLPQSAAADDAHRRSRAAGARGARAKDLILGAIGQIGADGARRPRGRVRRRGDPRRSRWRAA